MAVVVMVIRSIIIENFLV